MKNLQPYRDCFAHKNAIYISTETQSQKPCCYFKGGVDAKTYHEYKQEISKVDIAEGCSHCIEIEEGGATWSHRLQYEQDFYKHNGKIFVIGVCFDNICNIKCTTCGPANSSKWIEDYSKMNLWQNKDQKKFYVRMTKQAPDKIAFIKNLLDNEEFDVVRFDIFGGEPSINPTIIEFLDWLTTTDITNKIMINITTNATTYFANLMHYITKFKTISIQMSIDGIKDRFEYLRFGAQWETVSRNIIHYDKLATEFNNVYPSVHFTLSWMNSDHFFDFYQWLFENTSSLVGIHLTKVVGPQIYSVDILDPEVKKSIVDKTLAKIDALDLSKLSEIQQNNFKHFRDVYATNMQNYVVPLYKNAKLKIDALERLDKLDNIRLTDYKKTFVSLVERL